MSDDKNEVPVAGLSLWGLGAYLVILTLTIVIVIWNVIPSCDGADFVVTRLMPSRVLASGGEQVRIAGEGFESGVDVRVGDKTLSASVTSPFEIMFTAPALPVGRVAVVVTQRGFPPMDVPGGLEYIRTGPIVKGVVPTQALVEGNETLRILGERFKEGARVKIGTLEAATARFVSTTELSVTTAKHAAGVVPVEVTQGTESATLEGHLQFVAARTPAAPLVLQLSTIEPATARSTGGEAVTIIGAGFTENMTVRFGGVPARSTHVDGSRFITAVTPMHAPGAVGVTVGNDQSLGSLDGRFSFVCPAPTDRTLVLLVLLAGALGGLVHALRSFYWYCGERTLIRQWVPMYLLLPFSSAALGFVFYLLVRAGLYQPTAGTSYLLVGLATLVGMFSAQASEKLKAIAEGIFTKAPQGANPSPALAPTVSGIKPASGPTAGGTVVTIAGKGFTPQSVVRFDQTVSAKTTHVNATTLEAVAPAHAAGVVDVTVKVGDKEIVKDKAYTYVASKGTITDINPKDGVVAGGTKITITGTQFAGNVVVSFGDVPGSAAKVVSDTIVEVVTPPHAAGKVDVRIDAGSNLIAVAPAGFEYKA